MEQSQERYNTPRSRDRIMSQEMVEDNKDYMVEEERYEEPISQDRNNSREMDEVNEEDMEQFHERYPKRNYNESYQNNVKLSGDDEELIEQEKQNPHAPIQKNEKGFFGKKVEHFKQFFGKKEEGTKQFIEEEIENDNQMENDNQIKNDKQIFEPKKFVDEFTTKEEKYSNPVPSRKRGKSYKDNTDYDPEDDMSHGERKRAREDMEKKLAMYEPVRMCTFQSKSRILQDAKVRDLFHLLNRHLID